MVKIDGIDHASSHQVALQVTKLWSISRIVWGGIALLGVRVRNGKLMAYVTFRTLGEIIGIIYNSYCAGIDFRRQNMTSNVDHRTVRVKIFIIAVD